MSSTARKVTGIVWVLVWLLGLLPPLLSRANPDIAWPFFLAGRILEGARQGVDFLEVNPPLFLWLAVPPFLLERVSGIDAWVWHLFLTGALAGGSLFVTSWLLRPLIQGEPERRLLMLAAGVAGLILPRGDFGQREHLAFLATLPFVVLGARRLIGAAVPTSSSLVVGVSAALGFALKPYFVPVLLLIELYLLRRLGPRSWLRAELYSVVGVGALYAGAVLFLVPDYLSMALRLRPWYGQYLDRGLFLTSLAGPILLLAVPLALLIRATTRKDEVLLPILVVSFLGFLAGAILQAKGFEYHFAPAACFAFLAFARGSQLVHARHSSHAVGWVALAGPFLVLYLGAAAILDAGRRLGDVLDRSSDGSRALAELHTRLMRLAQGRRVMVFSSNPAYAWPLIREARAEWASRYMSLWPLPALYATDLRTRPGTMVIPRAINDAPAFEREFRAEVVADLERWDPDLLLFLVPDPTLPGRGGARRFDYLAYFRSDQRFSQFLAHFHSSEQIGPFSVWVRNDR